MSTISRRRLKTQAFIHRWQVDIVDLTGSYVRNPGIKSATIFDGAEPCRVEEFAARHFRRLGLMPRLSKASHLRCCSVCFSGR